MFFSEQVGWMFFIHHVFNVGQCKGHIFKPWRRKNDRNLIPYHVLSDIGNAMWIIASAYDPTSTLAFNEFGSQTFPFCWWS